MVNLMRLSLRNENAVLRLIKHPLGRSLFCAESSCFRRQQLVNQQLARMDGRKFTVDAQKALTRKGEPTEGSVRKRLAFEAPPYFAPASAFAGSLDGSGAVPSSTNASNLGFPGVSTFWGPALPVTDPTPPISAMYSLPFTW